MAKAQIFKSLAWWIFPLFGFSFAFFLACVKMTDGFSVVWFTWASVCSSQLKFFANFFCLSVNPNRKQHSQTKTPFRDKDTRRILRWQWKEKTDKPWQQGPWIPRHHHWRLEYRLGPLAHRQYELTERCADLQASKRHQSAVIQSTGKVLCPGLKNLFFYKSPKWWVLLGHWTVWSGERILKIGYSLAKIW